MNADIRCVKIKLKPNSSDKAKQWAHEINTRKNEALESLAKEGITLEAAFLDHIDGVDYLVYVMKGDILGSKAIAASSTSTLDLYHNQFKKDCWESIKELEPLVWLEPLLDEENAS